MNKHIKRGIVFGSCLAVVLFVVTIISIHNRDNPLWNTIFRGIGIIIWPVEFIWISTGISGCMAMGYLFWMIVSFLLWLFILGFGIGWSVSYAKERFTRHKFPAESHSVPQDGR